MPDLTAAESEEGETVFTPVTKDHIQNCSYDSWFPKYRSSCLKSRIIPLPPSFVSYLHEDGIILADDDEYKDEPDEEWHSATTSAKPPNRTEDSSDDEEDEVERLPPNQRFPETHQLIKDTIAELGGKVAPKLNWSSPKDAKWISPHQNTLKCTSPNDIYLLLKSSSFVSHDLTHAFDDCTAAPPTRPYAPVLVLRPFFVPHAALEFRCFVKHRTLVAITQRDLNYYSFLDRVRPQLWRRIRTFFHEKLRFTFPDASFAFDVYIPENSLENDGLGKVRLMDINPWAPRTDSLLFSWPELLDMEVRRPLYGSASIEAGAEVSGDETVTEGEDEDDTRYGPDSEPEFRILEKDDPAAFNFSSAQYSAHKLPKDVVDASLAGEGGIREFATQWKEMTEGRGGDMWNQGANTGSCLQLLPPQAQHPTYKQPLQHIVNRIASCQLPENRLALLAMPIRGRAHKVVKPSSANAGTNGHSNGRRASRNSSLSSAAQEQLEQFAQQAHTNADGASPDLDASLPSLNTSGGDLNATNLLANGSSMASLHPSLQGSFQMDDMTDHEHDQEHGQDPTRTAADVALEAYGDLVKIDSALCKKLAGDAALREPAQRRHDQKLNMERRSNVEALLAHVTGELAPRPCKNCHKGHGPWTTCVIYDENNNPQPPPIYAPSIPITQGQGPILAPTPTPAPAVMPYQPVPMVLQPSPGSVGVGMPPLQADISHWGLTDNTKRLVTRAMDEVTGLSRRDRYIARIEAAAKELGMRIAEYDDFLRSPEGMAEQQRAQEQEHDLGHTSDAGMDDVPSHDSPLS
ncbi:hypothetical protein G7046_g1431 [Stylonectria norvegica]|nr:hypothetical protein G7046_g1431 [Stylonectria norvegica]